MNIIEEIKRLKSLLDQGAITLDEFNMLKKNVLAKEEEKSIGTPMVNPNTPMEVSDQKMIENEIKSTNTPQRPRVIRSLFFIGLVICIIYAVNHGSSSDNSSSPSSDSSSEQEIGVFLINNTFANYEIGGTAYLKFSSQRGGGYGAMTMSMGSCDFVYSYDISGRHIQLTYTGSTCNAQGSSQTMTFNYDNTISVIIRGQSFIFKPI